MIFIYVCCIISLVNIMNLKIKKLIISEITISLSILMLYFICNSNLLNLVPKCIVNENFNILCPSCGATRCVICIFNLEFLNAFLYNPLIFVLIIYFILLNFIYIYNTLFNKKALRLLYYKNIYIILIISILLFTIFRNIL